MKVFLDLEGTLIETWFNPIILEEKIRKIKLFLQTHKVEDVDIFSYAILNVQDYSRFLSMEEVLEQELSAEIDEVHLAEHILTTVSRYTNLIYSDWLDFTSVTYKHQVFYDYCLARAEDNSNALCVLIDDVVPTRMVVNYTPKIAALTININELDNFCTQDILAEFG